MNEAICTTSEEVIYAVTNCGGAQIKLSPLVTHLELYGISNICISDLSRYDQQAELRSSYENPCSVSENKYCTLFDRSQW
jgi:hypothetical protein